MMCPRCEVEIKTNGIGAQNSPKFNWFLQNIYRYSCRIFEEAANLHDCHYAMYGFDKQKADLQFLQDMHVAIQFANPNWFKKKWLNYQANKFYLAVKLYGQDAYDTAQFTCLKQMNLNSRKVQ